MFRSCIFISHNTIHPDFEQTIVGVGQSRTPKFFSFFFSYSLTRDLGACGFAHVFRLPDINSITDGTVAARRTKLSALAKFALANSSVKLQISGYCCIFFFCGNYAAGYGRFSFSMILA